MDRAVVAVTVCMGKASVITCVLSSDSILRTSAITYPSPWRDSCVAALGDKHEAPHGEGLGGSLRSACLRLIARHMEI